MNIEYDHVSLRVTDLDRSIAFYTETFGLEMISRAENGSMAVFRVGQAVLVLFCSPNYRPVDPESGAGTDHVAFCLDTKAYDSILERLQSENRVLRGPTLNSGARGQGLATYFKDPDGNELEIKKYDA